MSDDAPPAEEPDSEHLTVLEALSSKLGAAPHLSLKDEGSGDGGSPVVKPASDAARAALPKGKGNYQLMGEIARGGMGVVFKGHDTDLGRDVALKVLHADLASDPAILQRFVEEAQIGGQLQHPGIVPVYELGLMADDRPYFTMKLVKGRTLSTLLSERDDVDQDRRRFLSIFEQVCQTMAYAHSRDVLHRDLKPSNIMVGAFGEVQVVDWGLAKVLHRDGSASDADLAERTAVSVIETVRSGSSTTGTDSVAGSVLGTPAYMSPEQAQGNVEDLDERCDVFTLGGVLCQILTGQPPYPGQKRFALSQAAAADQAQVRARLAECGADAELVALTGECLAQKPVDRPRNAGAVAKRIAAYLASLEERAQRAEIEVAESRVRAENERKARRLTVALALATFAVLIVGAGSWIWITGERADRRQEELAQEAERERVELAQEAERERVELARIAARRRETEGLVYDALSEASFARAQEDWSSAKAAVQRARGHLEKEPDPELEKAIDREAQREASAESLAAEESERAEQLAKFLDRMERNRGDLWLISNAQYRLDAYEQAFVDFGIDLTYLSEEEVVGASLESGRPADIALALVNLAWFHNEVVSGQPVRLSRFATAMDPDPLRTAAREAMNTNDVNRLLDLARDAEARELSPLSALVLVSGLRWINAKNHSIRILKRTARLHPSDASVHILLGELLLDSDPEGALLHLSVARGLQPESPYVLQLLGRVHREFGDTGEATRFLRRAVALHPGEPQNHIHLGLALRAEGDEEQALESFRAAVEIDAGCLDEYVGTNIQASLGLFNRRKYEQSAWYARRAIELDGESDEAYFRLGLALMGSGLDDEAIEASRTAIRLNPNHGWANNSLGNLLKGQEAIEAFQRQIDINPNTGHNNLGLRLMNMGNYDAAIQSFQSAIVIKPRQPQYRLNLAFAFYQKGEYDDALERLRQARELDQEYCNTLHHLAWFLAHVPDAELQDATQAVHLAKMSVELHGDQPVHEQIHAFWIHWAVLGQAYYRADRLTECVDALVKGIDLSQSDPDATDSFFLAMAHHKLGATEEARTWFDAGVEWMKNNDLTVPNEADLSRWRDEAHKLLGL